MGIICLFYLCVLGFLCGAKFKNDKTNPIEKSLTYYTERTNPKNRKIKTNPNEPNREKLCLYAERYTLDADYKTNPIFSRPNMQYQYQNRRNGGQKTTQKNETNPFVDNLTWPKPPCFGSFRPD
jgi:hypothetical protein